MTTEIIYIKEDAQKAEAVDILKQYITAEGFTASAFDVERPWGGFARIDEGQIMSFIERYFDNDPDLIKEAAERKMSPKFLLIAPDAQLSWQYHFRRTEEWTALLGPAGVYVSNTDEQPENGILLNTRDAISIGELERHRLVGMGQWAVIAEIWRHTDPENPSNEDDIVRVTDLYDRPTPA